MEIIKQKFNGEEVRFKFDESNNAIVNLEDVTKFCGWEKSEIKKEKEYKSIRWKQVKEHLVKIGFDDVLSKTSKELKELYIEERYMYMLIARADNDKSKEFMNWVAKIITDIRRNGFYVATEKDSKWLGIRYDSKENRKRETDEIKKFIEYAKSQGSKSADKYYIHFSKLANKYAGIESSSRENATQMELIEVMVAENLIRKYIKKLLDKSIPYKELYQKIKQKLKELE